MAMRFLILLATTIVVNAFLPTPLLLRSSNRGGCQLLQAHPWVMSTTDVRGALNGLARRDLQFVAKENGIKANLPTREIIESLTSISGKDLRTTLQKIPNHHTEKKSNHLQSNKAPFINTKKHEGDHLWIPDKELKAELDKIPKTHVSHGEGTSSSSHLKLMPQEAEPGFSTMAVHGPGKLHDKLGSVVMPIYQTSTFRFESAEHGAACFAGENPGFIYSRINNPTVRELEQALAALEHGYDGIATSSGMGAVTVVYMSLLAAGKHVISHKTVYGPSRALLENTMCKNFGVTASFIDTTDIEQVKAAIRPETTMIYLESPANPTVAISNIPAICKLAKERGITVCVDNTFCSPYLQNPLVLGADIVIHSLTKSINGHADTIGGVIVTKSEEMYKKLRPFMVTLGTCMDPNQAFLIRRGMKTLGLRVEAAQKNAVKVANFLEQHEKIAWVRFPGLASHPQHELSRRIMRGPGSMISFGVKGGIAAGRKLLNSVRLCVLAVSLGGIETLIQHPASMTHAKLTPEARLQGDVTDDLVRLSVGIEDADDIINDLRQALSRV